MSAASDPPLRLSEVLAGLSLALDLVEGQTMGHAGRTCVVGMHIAARLGLEAKERAALFYALLLKDAGCSSNAARIAALFGHDDRLIKRDRVLLNPAGKIAFARYAARHVRPDAPLHLRARGVVRVIRGARRSISDITRLRCDRGAAVAREIGLPEATAEAIRALDERWDGRGAPDRLVGTAIPLGARITAVAQTAEVFVTGRGAAAADAALRRRAGTLLDPTVVEAALPLVADRAFWAGLTGNGWREQVPKLEPPDRVCLADDAALDRVAVAFAHVIDAKSPYTLGHSVRVAAIASLLAERLGRPAAARPDLRRAALLHDIGKLGVPNTILDTGRPLTAREWRVVRRHPALSARILAPIRHFGTVAELASAHHERLDGSGYHRGLDASALGPDARILAVADVYEALTSERPYQRARDPEAGMEVLATYVPRALWADAAHALADAVAEGAPQVAPPPDARDDAGAAPPG